MPDPNEEKAEHASAATARSIPSGERAAESFADGGELSPLFAPGSVRSTPHSEWPGYPESVERARSESGADEAIGAWRASVGGVHVVIIAGEFEFLAGSLGRVAADRIVDAVRIAVAENAPVVALPISGGTRMQEGTPAFVRMSAIAGAFAEHRAAGLPCLVWLRSPTFGGVMATVGSLGDVAFAAPDAQVGFLGPRVYEGVTGEAFPVGIQVGENLADVGVIDGVRDAPQARAEFVGLLRAWSARPRGEKTARVAPGEGQGTLPPDHLEASTRAWSWPDLAATLHAGRPGARDLLAALDPAWVELSGTQAGERDPQAIVGVATLDADGESPLGCVVLAHDRAAEGEGITPGGLRTLARGAALASRWGLPVLSLVDTNGGELSAAAESAAMAGEIARSLARLMELDAPSVSMIVGAGCGGAAQALLPADVVLAVDQAWLAPLPVWGASVIVHRTPDRAPEMAHVQRIGASELLAAGIVDQVVATGIDPEADQASFTGSLAQSARAGLRQAVSQWDSQESPGERIRRRSVRFEQA